MSRISESGRDPGHVVVADEGQRRSRLDHGGVPIERPGQLEEVAIVETAPDRFPQLVLGDRVEAAVAQERGVVAVDDLTDEPCLRVGQTDAIDGSLPEGRLDGVRGVKSPPRRPAIEPVGHHSCGVVEYLRFVMIQLPQGGMTFEVTTGEPPARRWEIVAHVVENPVQKHPQPTLTGRTDELVEVVVVTQPRIDAEVVDSVVPVGLGGEDRSQLQPGGAELDRVVEPVGDL
jgi:hypothetical protein